MILWLDLETYSECDLKTHGTHRYSEHPSTEIIVAQWGVNDGAPQVADCTGRRMPKELLELIRNADEIWAHNSPFDRTILRNVWKVTPPITRWRDTMVQALAHGLPGGLDKVGQIVGLDDDQAKDKRGRELIMLFCKPRPKGSTLRRATAATHPQQWAEFLEYSRQDIVAMRAIHARLPKWNYPNNAKELALWHLDQEINDRGFEVDLDLAAAAVDAVAIEQKRMRKEVHDATNGEVGDVSRRDALLAHICAEYGVDLPDMKADTLRRRVEDPDLPDGVKLLLSLRLEATKTSTAKYRALANATSADGRLRNTLQFAGAQRTARWAGRIFQPHNLPRPAPGFGEAEQDELIEWLKAGCAELVYNNVMQETSNCVRGALVAPAGKKYCVSDLANIEGRGLAYLAGESWKLKAFAAFDNGEGEDMYKLAYARSFNADGKAVTKSQRSIGKVQELALGYQGGVAAFLTFAAVYRMDLEDLAAAVYATARPEALENARGMWGWAVKNKRALGLSERVYVACEVLKRAWRDAHPNTEMLWTAAEDAVRSAIKNPGETFSIGQHLKARKDGAWLRVRLPSGRYLCYINPQVADSGDISYFGVNQYTRQWGRIKTYGGKLCLAAGTLVMAKRGWITIEDITTDDEVFDGSEWVRTDGNVCNGAKEVINAYGAWMTPDHLVLTTKGWECASQSQGHNRAACRLPDSVTLPRERRAPVTVESQVRLRDGEGGGSERLSEAGEAGRHGLVRVQAVRVNRSKEHNPRHERAPGLRGVAQHVRQVLSANAPGVAQLRRPGHFSVRCLAEFFRQVLGRHGADVCGRTDAGPKKQLAGLQREKLLLGDLQGTGEQHPSEPDGWEQDRVATGRRVGREALDDVLPAGPRGPLGQTGRGPKLLAQVYDLINCGPRHRFVIWAGGAPLIVHNCENATQGFARDILAENMPAVNAAGYKTVLGVHDELINEAPDTSEFTSSHLAELMSTVPVWAKGMPIAAAGFECKRYRKE